MLRRQFYRGLVQRFPMLQLVCELAHRGVVASARQPYRVEPILTIAYRLEQLGVMLLRDFIRARYPIL